MIISKVITLVLALWLFPTAGWGAVAHDAATESATWTTAPNPFTFTVTPVGAPRGVACFIARGIVAAGDDIASVSYGGVSMTRVAFAQDTSGEWGKVWIYWLGTEIPSGPQTVSIAHTAAVGIAKIATCITVTAATDTTITSPDILLGGDQADPRIGLVSSTLPSPTGNALRYGVIYSGHDDPLNLSLLPGMTAVSDHDFGTFSTRVDRETTESSGNFSFGYTATIDDVAMAAIAIKEIQAQPSITSTTGTWSHGGTVTISGNLFGTKSVAAPLARHDFANGLAPSGLDTNSITVFNNTDTPRTVYSAYTTRFDHKLAGNDFFSYNTATHPKWYVSYWIKLASNWHWGTTAFGGGDDGLANIKFLRMFPTGARNYTNSGYSFNGFGDPGFRFAELPTLETQQLFDLRAVMTVGTWHQVELEYGENSAVDIRDGTSHLWIDGVAYDKKSAMVTNFGSDGTAVDKRPYIMGIYDSWPPSDSAETTQYTYIGEIYVDNSWSRVLLCSGVTWTVRGGCEAQIPSAWSDTSVSVTVNKGAFPIDQNVYLYIVDSAGAVNANGFLIGNPYVPPSGPRATVTRTPVTRTPVTRTPVTR